MSTGLAVKPNGEVLPQQQAPSIMQMIAALSTSGQVTGEHVGVMQALIGMQERQEAKDAEREFNRAFKAASERMPKIRKDGTISMGDKGKIPFAKYETVDQIVSEIEREFGFTRSFTSQLPPVGVSAVVMVCNLMHSAGHSKSSTMQLPPDPGPGRNALQAMGSSRSYGKRYLTLDIWNIVTEGADDDGRSASKVGEREIQAIEDMFTACNMQGDFDKEAAGKRKAFFKWAGVERIRDIQMADFQKVMRALQDKQRQIQEGK